MEHFNLHQIEQFLQLQLEIVGSADHLKASNDSQFWGDREKDTISSMTITTSMTSGRINL